MKRAIGVTIAAGFASLLLGGGNAALASGAHAKANLYRESHGCGAANTAGRVVGTVTLKRINRGPVAVKVKLKEGVPNTKYVVGLYGTHCVLELSQTLEFTTNKKGVGKVSGTVPVGEEEEEFAVGVEVEGAITALPDDTPSVMLP
jgi:hypothetical protein